MEVLTLKNKCFYIKGVLVTKENLQDIQKWVDEEGDGKNEIVIYENSDHEAIFGVLQSKEPEGEAKSFRASICNGDIIAKGLNNEIYIIPESKVVDTVEVVTGDSCSCGGACKCEDAAVTTDITRSEAENQEKLNFS